MDSRPIGIFDSGIGGTSIWKEIKELLPNEDCIYLADSKNAPYGEKSEEEILQLSIKNTDYLIRKNCKIIVVACNTATTNAIAYLRENYNLPFIGIEPAIKPAALNSKSKAIGILATKGTLSSGLFHSTVKNFGGENLIIEQQGAGLVQLIENDELYSDQLRQLLLKYLAPMLVKNIDYLVLGCTHYPYLIPILKELLPENIKIIDSGQAVAKQTKAILQKNDLLSIDKTLGSHQFYTTGSVEVLTNFVASKELNTKVSFLDF